MYLQRYPHTSVAVYSLEDHTVFPYFFIRMSKVNFVLVSALFGKIEVRYMD